MCEQSEKEGRHIVCDENEASLFAVRSIEDAYLI